MTRRFRGLESEKFDHRFHLRTSNLPKSQSLVLPSEKFQSPRHPIRVASAHDPVALLRESTVAIILAVVGSGRGREQLARQPAASIDDNNYRVTMDDFLIRLLAGASACTLGWLSRLPRVCAQRRYRIVCLELSAASVTGSREHARARTLGSACTATYTSLLERIPISDMQIDLPARPLLRNRRISGRRWCIYQPRRTYLRGAIVDFDLYPSVERSSTLRSHVSPATTFF